MGQNQHIASVREQWEATAARVFQQPGADKPRTPEGAAAKAEMWAEAVKLSATERNLTPLKTMFEVGTLAKEEEEVAAPAATTAAAGVMGLAVLSGLEQSLVGALSPEVLCIYIAQVAEFMSQLWVAYNAALLAGGYVGMLAKATTSSTIMGMGDIIGQRLFPAEPQPEETEEEESALQRVVSSLPFADALPFAQKEEPVAAEEEDAAVAYDPKRTGDFALVGAIIAAPIDKWYAFLGTIDLSTVLPAAMPKAVGMVMLDQLMWAPFCLASVFGMLSALQGDGLEGWKDKMRTTWGKTVVSNWLLWVPAQMLNFLIVPPQLQLLYANVVGLGWNVYLSKVSTEEKSD